MKLFGNSGIRRPVDGDFLALAIKVGLALGQQYPRLIIGRDTRTSGEAMRNAVVAGALAVGASVADAGIIPTPTLALAAKSFDAGIVITASHNPPQYNGIKLWNPDGSAFDPAQQQAIEDLVLGETLAVGPWQTMGPATVYDGAVNEHLRRTMADVPGPVNLNVVLDCACGAAAVITPYLLAEMGCRVTNLNDRPDGIFPHSPEPTPESLETLIKTTRELGADIGIAHDGDADRMMLIDDRGRFVPGDKLLALFARELDAGALVTTVDASMAVDEMGLEVTRTPVGDSFVSQALRQGGAAFGGEPCGAWIFPEVSLCPDGIYAAARAVIMASRQPLSELIDQVLEYPMRRGSLASNGLALADLEPRLARLGPRSVSHADGLRLSFDDGWLLLRPSGTEPLIRITTEAKTEAAAEKYYEDCRAVIENAVEAK